MKLLETLAIIMVTNIAGSLANTWYVVPSDDDGGGCPSGMHCKTLEYYAGYASEYFNNDTTFLFLTGTHKLNGSLIVEEVTNLTLRGINETAIINCIQSEITSISFERSSNIIISQIAITNCGKKKMSESDHSFESDDDSPSFEKCAIKDIDKNKTFIALFFDRVRDIHLSEVHVTNTRGYGLFLNQCWGQITVTSSQFCGNKGGKDYNGGNMYLVVKKYCSHGAKVNISDSSFSDGLSHSQYLKHRGVSASGIHICSFCPVSTIRITGCSITSNHGGNMYIFMLDFIHYYWQVYIDNCNITEGKAFEGAGLRFATRLHRPDYKFCENYNNKTNVWKVTSTNFSDNIANYSAGAAKMQLTESDCKHTSMVFNKSNFSNNQIQSKFAQGAAIRIMKHEIPDFRLIRIAKHQLKFVNVTFKDHSLTGKSYASVVKVENFANLTFEDCNFLSNSATALSLKASLIVFAGNVHFEGNTAMNGGAMKLCESSSFFINNKTSIHFKSNYAIRTGGAIFVQDSCTGQYGACFFQPNVDRAMIDRLGVDNDMRVKFSNNSAGIAGNSIYGGSIERCHTYNFFSLGMKKGFNFALEIVDHIFHFDTNDLSAHISSDAYKVLFCDSHYMDPSVNFPVTPGKTFSVSIRSVGQVNGSSSGVVTAHLNSLNSTDATAVTPIGYYKPTTKCTRLSLKVNSTYPEKRYTLVLQVQQTDPEFIYGPKMHQHLNIWITKCPWGFYLDNNTGICECSSIKSYHIQCYLEDLTLQKDYIQHIWIGCDSNNESCLDHDLLYGICGQADYCNNSANITANTTKDQCVSGRTGLACGACEKNLSALLGSSKCKPCKNSYLGLLPVYLATPVLLMIFISVFSTTVANGSIYGFLFYMSFIHANQPLFYSTDEFEHKQHILIIIPYIVSWLNFDLGIQVCFFDGMNVYHKTWLEFGFILYIWALEALVVYLCRRYTFFTRLCGSNVNKVLSTILYMTTLKSARLGFQSLVFSTIWSTNENTATFKVWSPQTTIRYLSLPHIPLFLFAMVILSLLLIFVCSLLFIQFLRRKSYFYVRRLLPFFETFIGPCNDTHAFWPGLIIFVQALFHFMISVYIFSNSTVIVITGLASLFLIIISFLGPHGVYKKWSLNILEFSYLLNLFILSLMTFFRDYFDRLDSTVEVTISVLLALLCFILYHFRQKLQKMIMHVYNTFLVTIRRYRNPSGTSLGNVASYSTEPEGSNESNQASPLLPSKKVS